MRVDFDFTLLCVYSYNLYNLKCRYPIFYITIAPKIGSMSSTGFKGLIDFTTDCILFHNTVMFSLWALLDIYINYKIKSKLCYKLYFCRNDIIFYLNLDSFSTQFYFCYRHMFKIGFIWKPRIFTICCFMRKGTFMFVGIVQWQKTCIKR